MPHHKCVQFALSYKLDARRFQNIMQHFRIKWAGRKMRVGPCGAACWKCASTIIIPPQVFSWCYIVEVAQIWVLPLVEAVEVEAIHLM